MATPDLGAQVVVNALALSSDRTLLLVGDQAGAQAGFTNGFVARVFP